MRFVSSNKFILAYLIFSYWRNRKFPYIDGHSPKIQSVRWKIVQNSLLLLRQRNYTGIHIAKGRTELYCIFFNRFRSRRFWIANSTVVRVDIPLSFWFDKEYVSLKLIYRFMQKVSIWVEKSDWLLCGSLRAIWTCISYVSISSMLGMYNDWIISISAYIGKRHRRRLECDQSECKNSTICGAHFQTSVRIYSCAFEWKTFAWNLLFGCLWKYPDRSIYMLS